MEEVEHGDRRGARKLIVRVDLIALPETCNTRPATDLRRRLHANRFENCNFWRQRDTAVNEQRRGRWFYARGGIYGFQQVFISPPNKIRIDRARYQIENFFCFFFYEDGGVWEQFCPLKYVYDIAVAFITGCCFQIIISPRSLVRQKIRFFIRNKINTCSFST